jgi:uncharacterized membrane protein
MCFGPEALIQLAIAVVVIIAAIALVRLVLPTFAMPAPYAQAINILIWALVAIVVIIFIAKLFACAGFMRLGMLGWSLLAVAPIYS